MKIVRGMASVQRNECSVRLFGSSVVNDAPGRVRRALCRAFSEELLSDGKPSFAAQEPFAAMTLLLWSLCTADTACGKCSPSHSMHKARWDL